MTNDQKERRSTTYRTRRAQDHYVEFESPAAVCLSFPQKFQEWKAFCQMMRVDPCAPPIEGGESDEASKEGVAVLPNEYSSPFASEN